ncbi:MAG: ferric reductase-like transmembrane domain-containing protein [Acidobacteriota bacterium]|nr:ferric reductase-like transmembrane domain-containing protein [Acidobacteriota bacterium]
MYSATVQASASRDRQQIQRRRLRYRLAAHHVPLMLASAACVAVLYLTRTYTDVLSRLSFATAYPALALVAASLLIGPWNVLRKRRNAVSSDLRRDVGIWAGILGVIHTAVGQNVHLRGRPWLYYVYEAKEKHSFPLRHDLFGLANYTGALSVLLLAGLFATSNDYSLRALGTRGWKQLQRWNYGVFALAAVHAVAYQASEKQKPPYLLSVLACIALTVCVQVAGFLRRRGTDREEDGRGAIQG